MVGQSRVRVEPLKSERGGAHFSVLLNPAVPPVSRRRTCLFTYQPSTAFNHAHCRQCRVPSRCAYGAILQLPVVWGLSREKPVTADMTMLVHLSPPAGQRSILIHTPCRCLVHRENEAEWRSDGCSPNSVQYSLLAVLCRVSRSHHHTHAQEKQCNVTLGDAYRLLAAELYC